MTHITTNELEIESESERIKASIISKLEDDLER